MKRPRGRSIGNRVVIGGFLLIIITMFFAAWYAHKSKTLTDATTLLTTLAQIAGTIVAILCGFILTHILDFMGERRVLRRRGRELISDYENVTTKRTKSNAETFAAKVLAVKLKDIEQELDALADPRNYIVALAGLVTVTLFGLIIPLILLALGDVHLRVAYQVTLVAEMLNGLMLLFIVMVHYIWI